LKNLRQYIVPQRVDDPHFTPFTRIKFFWLKAANAAANERSLVKLIWSTDGQSFQYSRPGLPPVKIQLDMLRKLVHSNLGELYQRFEQLLPSTFSISRIFALPWNELQDDASSSQSFLDTPESWKAWMEQAVNDLKEAYLDPLETAHSLMVNGQPSLAAVDKLIALDQHFQDALIVDELSNTGISPRAVILANYLYRSTPAETRHLYLMDGQLALYGGRQKGASRRDGYRELVVRTLCQQTQRCVLPYLGLFRAALVSILRDNKWYLNMADMYESHLIAGPCFKVGGSGGVNVSRISAPWHTISEQFFGTKLSVVDKRQIDSGVHKRLFPELLRVPDQAAKTAVDGQGDHGSGPSANHYGRSSNLCRGINEPELNDYIDTSNAHHALMQTGPVNPNWPYNIRQAVPFQRGYQEEIAMDAASVLVPHYYGFHRLTKEEISKVAKEICSGLTFLFRGDVSSSQLRK
jgi:hypothetical protein